jgi:hypothetical protein
MCRTVQLVGAPEDRLVGHRFPIEAELCYLLLNGKTIVAAGHGRSLNISSGGILFESMHSVRPGQQIELSIAWPAKIDGIVRMQLRASGRTVREQDNRTAVRILHYEFRTGSIREPNVRQGATTIFA